MPHHGAIILADHYDCRLAQKQNLDLENIIGYLA